MGGEQQRGGTDDQRRAGGTPLEGCYLKYSKSPPPQAGTPKFPPTPPSRKTRPPRIVCLNSIRRKRRTFTTRRNVAAECRGRCAAPRAAAFRGLYVFPTPARAGFIAGGAPTGVRLS